MATRSLNKHYTSLPNHCDACEYNYIWSTPPWPKTTKVKCFEMTLVQIHTQFRCTLIATIGLGFLSKIVVTITVDHEHMQCATCIGDWLCSPFDRNELMPAIHLIRMN